MGVLLLMSWSRKAWYLSRELSWRAMWLSGEGLSYTEGLPGLQVETQRCLGQLKMLRDSKGASTAGAEWVRKKVRKGGKLKPCHWGSFQQGKGFRCWSKCGGKPLRGFQQKVASPGLHFIDSLCHLGGKLTEVSKEDKSENWAICRVQARNAAALDWCGSGAPVRGGWIKKYEDRAHRNLI